MAALPALLNNSQFILDNFFTLKEADFLNTDLEFNKFVFEFDEFHSSESVITVHDQTFTTDKPADLNYYGADFFNKIKLGKGAFGNVIEYKDKTLKIFGTPFGRIYSGFNFEHYADKYVVPYRLYEGIANICINYLLSKYTNCYYQTHGMYLLTTQVFYDNAQSDKFSKAYIEEWNVEEPSWIDGMKTCMSMDKLSPIPFFFFDKGRKELYYILYIILSNLYFLRNLCLFVHGDLHLKNVMMIDSTDDVSLTYGDEIIKIPNLGWRPVMIDFGYSSFTYQGKRVSANAEARSPSGSNFDSYFDLAKIFGSLLNFRNVQGMTDFTDVEEIFVTTRGQPYDFYINEKQENKYKQLMQNNILKPLEEVLTFLSSKVQYTSSKTVGIPRIIDRFYEIVHFQQDSLQITPFIKYCNVKYKTVYPFFKQAPYSTTLNVHVIEIDNHIDNYVFKTKCCKQTVFDFISEHEGVAINGTYFDIQNAEYIKKLDTRTNHKTNIEEFDYIDVYGQVVVYEHRIGMSTVSNSQVIQDSDYGTKSNVKQMYVDPNTNTFLAGPIIVIDGKPFPLDIRDTFKDKAPFEIYKYSCSDDSADFEKYSAYARTPDIHGVRFFNCKQIEPGNLYHIGNPNPRTCLATKGDKTYFIVIEGRTKEYEGASYEQMQDFLVNYLQATWSINLDGGASSMMMWNIGGTVYCPMKVTNRKTVGNVVSFVKK